MPDRCVIYPRGYRTAHPRHPYSSCRVCGGEWITADGPPECAGFSPGDVMRATIGNGPWPTPRSGFPLVCTCGEVVSPEVKHECESVATDHPYCTGWMSCRAAVHDEGCDAVPVHPTEDE